MVLVYQSLIIYSGGGDSMNEMSYILYATSVYVE